MTESAEADRQIVLADGTVMQRGPLADDCPIEIALRLSPDIARLAVAVLAAEAEKYSAPVRYDHSLGGTRWYDHAYREFNDAAKAIAAALRDRAEREEME